MFRTIVRRMNPITYMSNALTTTKMLIALRRTAAPIMGVFAYGRVYAAAEAYPRGGVLRFAPLV